MTSSPWGRISFLSLPRFFCVSSAATVRGAVDATTETLPVGVLAARDVPRPKTRSLIRSYDLCFIKRPLGHSNTTHKPLKFFAFHGSIAHNSPSVGPSITPTLTARPTLSAGISRRFCPVVLMLMDIKMYYNATHLQGTSTEVPSGRRPEAKCH